ncbi:MAG: Guanylate kinase [Chloroflexi bacterium]|nr:Guanylate kinase [Chloroflexota bacterium]
MSSTTPLLIVVSGPSGVGKDALLCQMKDLGYPYFFAVTATTRPQRPGETDGVDYHFITEAKFTDMIEKGELLEWANVYGNLYGIPKKPVEQALVEGKDVIVRIDVQGAATIKRIAPHASLIFVSPPSMEELQRRLRERKTESPADLELRLKIAQREMETLPSFDYVVVSQKDGMDVAISQIEAIITAEKCRRRGLRFTVGLGGEPLNAEPWNLEPIDLPEVFLDGKEKIPGAASNQPAQ